MQLHRFEKLILKFLLEHGEADWGELRRGLSRDMSQGSLSKYKRSLEARGFIVKRLNARGKPVYTIPDDRRRLCIRLVQPRITLEEAKAFERFLLKTEEYWRKKCEEMLREEREEERKLDEWRGKMLKKLREKGEI